MVQFRFNWFLVIALACNLLLIAYLWVIVLPMYEAQGAGQMILLVMAIFAVSALPILLRMLTGTKEL